MHSKLNKNKKSSSLLNWTEEGNYPKSQIVYESLVNSFVATNVALWNQDFEVKFSGSTCWSLLIIGNKLYWANTGDSRWILIRIPKLSQLKLQHSKQQPHSYTDLLPHKSVLIESGEEVKELQITVLELSRDHKPDDKDEKERILLNGGEVQPYRDKKGEQLGPMRVWVK